MSGTFPTTPEPSDCTLTSLQPTYQTTSESGRRQARIAGGHLWRVKLNWSKSLRATFAPLFAFMARQRGKFESFTIVLPTHKTPLGVGTGSPVTLLPSSAGVSTILTTGWTVSITGILKAGDVMKFDSHTKVYMVTADANSDASGNSALVITPPLIEDVAGSVGITVNDVPFTVASAEDLVEWKASAPHLVSYSLNLVEHIG